MLRLPAIVLLVAGSAWAQSDDAIELVVRGDDFGHSHASNLALERAFAAGVMTSASMLAPGPWFSETAALARKHPQWSVGVHLTITSEWNVLRWRPVLPISQVPSLVAPDGYLWGYGYSASPLADRDPDASLWAEHQPNLAEVEQEFRAQIERAKGLGVRLDYIDCHMGMACREAIYPITKKLAREYCLAISNDGEHGLRRARANFPADTPEGIRSGLHEMLRDLTPGRWLFVGHPAADTAELRAIDSKRGDAVALRRSSVLQIWTEPQTRKLIDELGIRLLSMGELAREAGCGR